MKEKVFEAIKKSGKTAFACVTLVMAGRLTLNTT